MAEAAAAKVAKIAPGANTLREYETIYLVKQDMTTEQIDRIKERVRGIIDGQGGRVIKFTTWGKKKTAFLVGNKQARAIFIHVSYLGEGGTVAELERNFRNLEDILKYQTIKVSDAVLPESRPTEEDVVLEGDREEAPREEGREGGGYGRDREGGYGRDRDFGGRDRGDRGSDRGDRDDRGGGSEDSSESEDSND